MPPTLYKAQIFFLHFLQFPPSPTAKCIIVTDNYFASIIGISLNFLLFYSFYLHIKLFFSLAYSKKVGSLILRMAL